MDSDDAAEIMALQQVPASADPDHVVADEADDQGDMGPRSFLGAANTGDGGATEPVADAEPTPIIAVTGPPALAPAAAECTPKGWQAKKIPAFSLLGKVLTLTSEFVEYFTPFPKPKATPWEQQAPDFQNTQHCTDEQEVTGPDGGLNPKFWEHMTQHGHDHDCPTREEIMDPLWIFLCNMTVTFWRLLAVSTDGYAATTYAKEETADIAAGASRTRRAWTPISNSGRWWKLINFFGILVYRGVVSTGSY